MPNWLRKLLLGEWLYTYYQTMSAFDHADEMSDKAWRELGYLSYCSKHFPEKWDDQYIRVLNAQMDQIDAVEQAKAYRSLLDNLD